MSYRTKTRKVGAEVDRYVRIINDANVVCSEETSPGDPNEADPDLYENTGILDHFSLQDEGCPSSL